MKINYFIGLALCCVLLIACQNNEPNKADESKTNNEITEQLSDLVHGIGEIVSTKNLNDGSIVMTDDKGNIITKDKDGNITIVIKTGETITIDNSIYEDTSISKDKWYHSTWKGRIESYGNSHTDYTYSFIFYLKDCGFDYQTSHDIEIDSTKIYLDSVKYINLHFNNSTCFWQYLDTLKEITQTGKYTFKKYHISEQQVNNYTLKIQGDYAFIFRYNSMIAHCPIDKDSTISIVDKYEMNDKTENLIKTSVNTTFFNYRRVNDTQIAIINNSSSYLLKEESSSDMPKMEVYKDGSNQNISLKLVSL